MSRPPHMVVGIGASAGGLDAFRTFFEGMPPSSGMAFVIVQHLSPDHRSLLADLLARHTEMPVREAQDGMELQADHVYTIPPGRDLTLDGSLLRLHEQRLEDKLRLPIDRFFRSLAREWGDRAVAIVMSGGGSDGTRGLQEIKSCGGITVVQEPGEAANDGMPVSAVSSQQIDYVLSVAEMPDFLLGCSGLTLPPEEGGKRLTPDEELHLQTILKILSVRAGSQFRQHKRSTLLRRIWRRMGLRRMSELGLYAQLLTERPEEADALANDLLICVTSFFRDPEAWDALRAQVLEPLAAADGDPIRLWVPGCATGEEAYTLAMLMDDILTESQRTYQVFASDVSTHALATARHGSYPESLERDVPPRFLHRYFTREDGGYRVGTQLRERVLFAFHEVLSDPPFSRLHLISCRNLLIYLRPQAQASVLERFAFALQDGGFLFLGNSETVSNGSQSFEPVCNRARIFRRLARPAGQRPERAPSLRMPTVGDRRRTPPRLEEIVQKHALEMIQPPMALIRGNYQVLYLQGPVDRYLRLPSGEPRTGLVDLARPGLQMRLRQAVRSALEENRQVESRPTQLKLEDGVAWVSMTVRPLDEAEAAGDRTLLVWFREVVPPDSFRTPSEGTVRSADEAVRLLEHELEQTRLELSSTIDQLESANQELGASNEEAMSMNEELQSANEELEASKEELQSLNEELVTLNQQLEEKVGELEETTDDLLNLISSARIATLFLDTDFRIRRFTPEAVDLFHLIHSDVGRPLSDLGHKFTGEDLLRDAREVLERLVPIERQVQTRDERWFLRRILPYQTQDRRILGVVVVFHDVSRLKAVEDSFRETAEELRRKERQLELVTDSLPVLISYVDAELKYRFNNLEYERWFGHAREQVYGKTIQEVIGVEAFEAVRPYVDAVFEGRRVTYERLLPYKEGGARWVRAEYVPHFDQEGEVQGFFALIFDLTERRRAEEALKQSEEEFRAIFTLAAAGKSQVDTLTRRFIRVNRKYCEMTGYDEKELYGKSPLDLVHPDDREHAEADLVPVWEGRREGWQHDLRCLRKDGGVLWIHVSGALVRRPDGTPTYTVASILDITERKQAQLQSQRLLEQLRQSSEQKDHFLATLAHELRNPLAAISGALLLFDGPNLEERWDWIKTTMERNTKLLVRLLDDLLDISRITRGKIHLRLEHVFVSEVVRQAVEDLRQVLTERRQSLEFDCSDESLSVQADPARLVQVFLNLLNNASKYTPEGGSITIQVRREEDEAVVEVSDDGIGISEDQLPHIFDLFNQAGGNTSSGLGIGLALVRQLIELHRGSVSAHSPGEGQGSTFTVRLAALEAGVTPPASPPERPRAGSKSLRVTVVDDNVEAAHALRLLLEDAGHRVEVAHSGQSGLELVRGQKPDVLLLDIGMPDLDGRAVARRLRELGHQRLLIVAISGFGQKQDVEGSRQAGFDAHLVKPVNPQKLFELLESYQPLDPHRVLVVDDNEMVLRVTRAVLEQQGFEVETAATGEEGLSRAVEYRPGTVLCDLNLAGAMDGLEVARALRSRSETRPCLLIAVTGHDEQDYHEVINQAGFDVLLTKPVDFERLRSLVER